MNKPFRPHPQMLQPLQSGPLAPHFDSFAAWLAQQRYCCVTGWNKLRLVADLSHWMVQRKLQLEGLNEQQVAKFLADAGNVSFITAAINAPWRICYNTCVNWISSRRRGLRR